MFSQILDTLSYVVSELLRKSKATRAVFISIAVAIAAGCAALVYAATVGHMFFSGRELKFIDVMPVVLPSSFIATWMLAVVAISLVDPDQLRRFTERNRDDDRILNHFTDSLLAPIGVTVGRARKKEGYINVQGDRTAIGPPEKDGSAVDEDIIKGIRGNLGHLLEYYKMNKSQARNSFNASLSSIIAGFVTLVVGGVWAYTAERNDLTAYLVPFAGVILQFIGGGYFYLYNRSLIQLNFFFSRLAQMQDTLLAIHLSEAMPDGDAKNGALERLIFVIAERSTTAPAYLSEAYAKKPQAAQ
ncbi:TRADD-N-associated membrane domain-containing protein [Rhizobium leguminosarum]